MTVLEQILSEIVTTVKSLVRKPANPTGPAAMTQNEKGEVSTVLLSTLVPLPPGAKAGQTLVVGPNGVGAAVVNTPTADEQAKAVDARISAAIGSEETLKAILASLTTA
jgi:hypothetical protein